MKYLAPVARVSAGDCTRMAAAFVAHRCDTRQAGQLYTAWRKGTRLVRERTVLRARFAARLGDRFAGVGEDASSVSDSVLPSGS